MRAKGSTSRTPAAAVMRRASLVLVSPAPPANHVAAAVSVNRTIPGA